MKMFYLLLIIMLSVGITAFAAESPVKTGKLYHVVSLKFKDTAKKEDIKKIEDAFRALKTKIPQISTLEWGTNVSPEKHDKGFTHCFILSFKSDKDRNDYLVHPAHKEFGSILGPVLGDVFVIDFWAQH